jgi:hypothetical protein
MPHTVMPHTVASRSVARRAVALGVTLLAALAPLVAASAQQAPQQSVMRGRVVSADSAHHPIPDAEVTISVLQRGARTGADGTYELSGLPGGAHVVVVRRLGFVPVTRGVILSGEADDTAAVTFALAPNVAALEKVYVREGAGGEPRAMERERARSNGGVFIDRARLEQSEHSVMSNVLRSTPGLSIVRYPSSRGVYNVSAPHAARRASRARGGAVRPSARTRSTSTA